MCGPRVDWGARLCASGAGLAGDSGGGCSVSFGKIVGKIAGVGIVQGGTIAVWVGFAILVSEVADK